MLSFLLTITLLLNLSYSKCYEIATTRTRSYKDCRTINRQCDMRLTDADRANLKAVCQLYGCDWMETDMGWSTSVKCEGTKKGEEGRPVCQDIRDEAICKQEAGGLNKVFCQWLGQKGDFHYTQYIQMNGVSFNQEEVSSMIEEQSLVKFSRTRGHHQIEGVPLPPTMITENMEYLRKGIKTQHFEVSDATSTHKYTLTKDAKINAMSGILIAHFQEEDPAVPTQKHTQMTFIDGQHEWLVGCAHGVTSQEDTQLSWEIDLLFGKIKDTSFFIGLHNMYFVPSSAINGKKWDEIKNSEQKRDIEAVYIPNGYFLRRMSIAETEGGAPTPNFIRNWDVAFLKLKPLTPKPAAKLYHANLGYLANNKGEYKITTYSYPIKEITHWSENPWELYQYDFPITKLYPHIILSGYGDEDRKDDASGGQSGMAALLLPKPYEKYYVYGVYGGTIGTLPGFLFCRISFFVGKLILSEIGQTVPSGPRLIGYGKLEKKEKIKHETYPIDWHKRTLKYRCERIGSTRGPTAIWYAKPLMRTLEQLGIPPDQRAACIGIIEKYCQVVFT